MIHRVAIGWFVIFYLGAFLVSGVAQEHKTMTGEMEMSQGHHDVMDSSVEPEHKAPGAHTMETHSMPSHDHEKMTTASEQAVETDMTNLVRIDERLGEIIDFSARFVDSKNRAVDLKALFDKPVVLLPVYFMCPSVCTFLQANLAKTLNRTDGIPGKDFNVITLSFSDDEDYTHARTAKQNYTGTMDRKIDADNWYYLTGDRENILRLTRSLGYFFVKKEPYIYIHPSALVVLAADGKIIRYLYGSDFLPFDVGMALNEARKGEPGISIKRGVLAFCFSYDPENKTYVFKMFRITGTAILILLAGFVLFLIRPSDSRKQSGIRRGRQHLPPDT